MVEEGAHVRFTHRGAKVEGDVIKRMGLRVRVTLPTGATAWFELKDVEEIGGASPKSPPAATPGAAAGRDQATSCSGLAAASTSVPVPTPAPAAASLKPTPEEPSPVPAPPNPLALSAAEEYAAADAAALPQPLTAEELEMARSRYSTISVLRTLLTHDSARSGVPIRLVKASWLLTFFQANAGARLEHRQHLERTTPEAFVDGAMLERVLAELSSGKYMTEVGGEYKAVKMSFNTIPFALPSATAMSHM